jgi:hypothetical protein
MFGFADKLDRNAARRDRGPERARGIVVESASGQAVRVVNHIPDEVFEKLATNSVIAAVSAARREARLS